MKTLKAEHLAKSYGGREVVKDVSIRVESGQIVGLLGPNGAGKTTCFYMIVNLVQADRGRIMIDDEDISHLPMHGRARKGIGYLPQDVQLFPGTIKNNIARMRADARDEELHGRVRDELRVDEHEIGVVREEAVLDELALLGVDDRERRRRGVGASVLAAVGTLAHRMPARWPEAFAASMAERRSTGALPLPIGLRRRISSGRIPVSLGRMASASSLPTLSIMREPEKLTPIDLSASRCT